MYALVKETNSKVGKVGGVVECGSRFQQVVD